jgi:dihydroxyacetone kinase-like predicted kinase
LGDSIVVVGDGGVWNCHIHTDVVGPAIEAGVALGRPERIKVTDLLEQAADEAHHRGFEPLPGFAGSGVGVVAVAVGAGIVDLFRDAGVQGVVVGGQTMNPSVRDVLGVVEDVAAQTVIVLPNNKNIIPVAEQLNALTEKSVLVVPTRSIPEGLAAMLAFMPGKDAADSVEAMRAAAAACGWGEVTRAVRDAATPAGEIREGDWLGIVNGEVSVIAPTPAAAAVAVLNTLVDGAAEVVSVITGSEADDTVTAEITGHLAAEHVVVSVLAGGQPLYPYLFGVE